MKFKKAFAMMAALCVMSAASACGGSSTAGDSKTESSKAEESKQEVTTEKTEPTTSATTTMTTEAPIPAPLDGAITFDTASLYTATIMTDSGAAPAELAVVDLDGDKKLRVRVSKTPGKEDKDYEVPKILFDLPTLLGEDNVGKIGHISVDFTCVARGVWHNDDGTDSLVVGNFLGTIGGNVASGKGYDKEGNLIQNAWAQNDFSFQDWNNPTHNWRFETDIPALLPANGYATKDTTYYDKDGKEIENLAKDQNMLIMRWGQANDVDFYMDNITFLDKDGKVMEIKYDAAANTVDVQKDTMKTDAPATTELTTVEGATEKTTVELGEQTTVETAEQTTAPI